MCVDHQINNMFPTGDFAGEYLGRVGASPNGRFPKLRFPNQEQPLSAENSVTREGQQLMPGNICILSNANLIINFVWVSQGIRERFAAMSCQ